MAGDLEEIFQLALEYFYEKYKEKGGTQTKLARRLGVSQSYVSAVLTGIKKASIILQERLANILYGPYEEFLAVGRRLQNGLDPEFIIKGGEVDEVELLINKLSRYIRDYQRIEKDLIDTKNFYKRIIEKLQSGILVTDQNDKIYFLNDWLLNKIGVPKESVVGTSIFKASEIFPKVRLEGYLEYYSSAKETMDPKEFKNVSIIIPSGQKVYRSGWCIPIFDRTKYKGMILTIGDMTEETMLRKKLQDDTWLMQAAMDEELNAWVILDKSYRIIKRNAGFRKMFSMNGEAFLESSFRQYIEWIKSFMRDQDSFVQFSFLAIKQKKRIIQEFDLIDSRRIRWVSSPLFHDNDLLGRSILLYDITAEKDFL